VRRNLVTLRLSGAGPRSSSGSLAKFTAICRASSCVSRFGRRAVRRSDTSGIGGRSGSARLALETTLITPNKTWWPCPLRLLTRSFLGRRRRSEKSARFASEGGTVPGAKRWLVRSSQRWRAIIALAASAASAQSTTGQITVFYDIIEAAPATRTDSGIAVRFHVRARRPIQHGRLAHIVPAATHQAGAPAHAAPCVRFQAGQRRARHPCAARLYLGHKNIQHTVRYAELSEGFWRD
jgi:hypothetical protein